MTITVEFQIEVSDENAKNATDAQIREWVEFHLNYNCTLKNSPISDIDLEADYVGDINVYR